MTNDSIKAFLTHYIVGLKERTRNEASGPKWGIDWVIYNLGQTLYGKPVRLPFVRQQQSDETKSKSEAEFGVDVSFLSSDKKTLTIFVLKDEVLTNKSWVSQGFHEDMAKAIAPDMEAAGLEEVNQVEVILAYNKDEHANGIELFDRFASSAPNRLADRADLSLKRWNLSDLVDLTLEHLLTPALLPQKFFGQLNYLCSQFADFPHGSDPWEQQLIPGWQRFVEDALADEHGPRGPALLPIALIILREHAKDNPTVQTGWIDLLEWASIAMWRRFLASDDPKTRQHIHGFWISFYIVELDRFYTEHIDALATDNAIDSIGASSMVGAVASSMVAYWHIGRLGLLSLGCWENMVDESADQKAAKTRKLRSIASHLIRLHNANESAFRPILDIHHIEITLLMIALSNVGRHQDFGSITLNLVQRLYPRRLGYGELPFLDGGNSLSAVFEQVAENNESELLTTKSSYFVLVLMELVCVLEPSQRDDLLKSIHRRLVLGAMDEGPSGELSPLNLFSWVPPNDWQEQVLKGYSTQGTAVSRGPLSDNVDATAEELFGELKHFVDLMRRTNNPDLILTVPVSALILASMRHQTPMPPEFWRTSAFPKPEEEKTSTTVNDQGPEPTG